MVSSWGVIFDLLEALLVVSVVTVFATFAVRWVGFKLHLLDYPEPLRRMNRKPIPRNGGWALYVAIMIGCGIYLPLELAWVQGMMVALTVIFVAGVLDDVFDLSPTVQFGAQILSALVLFYFGVSIERLSNPFATGGVTYLELLALPVTVVWVVLIINAINFVDGLDGLAAGMAGMASASFTLIALMQGRIFVALLCAMICGLTIGFLPHNFHPASVFMGTTGSAILGILLATATIEGTLKFSSAAALVLPLLILGVPFFDTSFAIARRLKNRLPVFRPDRGHVHHRLINVGYSHRRAVLILYGWCAVMSALGLAIGYSYLPAVIITSIAALVGSYAMIRLLEINWRWQHKGGED